MIDKHRPHDPWAGEHLGGELGAALLLEPGQDGPLELVAGAEVVEQPARELLAVELAEHVLVADVGEQLDHLVQLLLYLLLAQLLGATLSIGLVASVIGSTEPQQRPIQHCQAPLFRASPGGEQSGSWLFWRSRGET